MHGRWYWGNGIEFSIDYFSQRKTSFPKETLGKCIFNDIQVVEDSSGHNQIIPMIRGSVANEKTL